MQFTTVTMEENYMIILVDAEKVFNFKKYPYMNSSLI